ALPGSVATSLPPLSYATLHRKQMHPLSIPLASGLPTLHYMNAFCLLDSEPGKKFPAPEQSLDSGVSSTARTVDVVTPLLKEKANPVPTHSNAGQVPNLSYLFSAAGSVML